MVGLGLLLRNSMLGSAWPPGETTWMLSVDEVGSDNAVAAADKTDGTPSSLARAECVEDANDSISRSNIADEEERLHIYEGISDLGFNSFK